MDLGTIVDNMLTFENAKRPAVISSKLRLGLANVDVTLEVYNSFTDRGPYQDNCIASPFERRIDCDLNLVEKLIQDFQLTKVYPRDRSYYKRYLLMWIVAHEIGHIACGHDMASYDEGKHGMAGFDASS